MTQNDPAIPISVKPDDLSFDSFSGNKRILLFLSLLISVFLRYENYIRDALPQFLSKLLTDKRSDILILLISILIYIVYISARLGRKDVEKSINQCTKTRITL